MPDLRYHVISLISVFLALTVGILLGIAMSDRGVLDAQIRDIRTDLENQRSVLDKRDAQIEQQRQVISGMSETMITGSLQGVDVALVSGPWVEGETYRGVRDALSASGADLVSAPPALTPVSSEEDPEETYMPTATEVLGYEPQSTTAVSGATTPDVIVFLGGGEPPEGTDPRILSDTADAESAMLEFWTGAGVRVVAAESSQGPRTQVPFFRRVGIPSVDNADSPAGQAAVVVLAAGTDEGSYGTRDDASGFFPPPPQE